MNREAWRQSAATIFWGVLALTVFGCVASFCEFFFGIMSTAKGYLDLALEHVGLSGASGHAEGLYKFFAVYNRMSAWTHLCEILTIGGWIAYIVGLSKFRNVQATQSGRWLAGNLYSACLLGLIAMACTFVGGFLGIFGMLFRFAGWILSLISLFKFRGAFNRLSIEESWDGLARKGAGNLRASYTFGIVLAFYPLIVFFVVLFVCLGSLGNLGNLTNSFASDPGSAIASVVGGSIAIVAFLALASVILWICQTCYLISGWNKIRNGALAGEDDDELRSDNSTLVILGSILAAILLMVAAVWTCMTPLTQTGATYSITPNEEYGAEYVDDGETYDYESEYEIEGETYHEAYDENLDIVGCDEYTYRYKGTINDKYAVELTITTDGGAYYTGEYRYANSTRPIVVNGQMMDDDNLVLEEYVGENMTGKFDGTLTADKYFGVWISSDGKKEFPFSLTLVGEN